MNTPKMRWYETAARYLLGSIFLFGAVDGAVFLLFGIYMHGKPAPRFTFLLSLQEVTYFWAFMKLIQALGSASLLANYKPAFGVALLIPISSVLCLFYIFEEPSFLLHFGGGIILSTIILVRAYSKSYACLFHDYPDRRPPSRL